MARCPYLSLEEEGTTPFPFSSPSHCCYVSRMGLPIGQQEQDRYCLTKKHTSCPLFLSQSLVEEAADELPEAVVEEEEPEVMVKPPLRERMEPLPTRQRVADEPLQAVVEEKPEVVVEPPLKEVAEALPTQEALAHKPVEAAVKEGRARVTVGPLLQEAERVGSAAISMALRALPWLVAGAVFLTILCIGGLVIFRVLSSPPEIAFPSFGLPSVSPGLLLLVSVISFAGAVLLIGLFLWTLRATTR